MKNHPKTITSLLAVLAVLAAGAYLYVQKPAVPEEESAPIVETALPQTTSTSSGNAVNTTSTTETNTVVAPVISSTQRCAQEVKKDIVDLKPKKIQVSFLEVQAFGSASLARKFIADRGYKNESGRGLQDIAAAGNGDDFSADFSVAIISLRSQLPSKEDESKLVTMKITQPVVCVAGVLASNSKTFLTTTLKDEAGVRAALYQSGAVVE